MKRFIVSEDNTKVTDNQLSVEWLRSESPEDVNFEDAQGLMNVLGDGWRLPTIEELSSLVDRTKHQPAIDSEVFPNTESGMYWSSTPCVWDVLNNRWVVVFKMGNVGFTTINDKAFVMPVRSILTS